MFEPLGTAYGFRFTLARGVEQLPAGMWALSADGRYGGGSAPNDQILYMDLRCDFARKRRRTAAMAAHMLSAMMGAFWSAHNGV